MCDQIATGDQEDLQGFWDCFSIVRTEPLWATSSTVINTLSETQCEQALQNSNLAEDRYYEAQSYVVLQPWLPTSPRTYWSQCLPRRTFTLKHHLFNICYGRRRKPGFWASLFYVGVYNAESLAAQMLACYLDETADPPLTPAEVSCYCFLLQNGFSFHWDALLCVAVHLTIVFRRHMPNVVGCRLVSASVPYALGHPSISIILAWADPSFPPAKKSTQLPSSATGISGCSQQPPGSSDSGSKYRKLGTAAPSGPLTIDRRSLDDNFYWRRVCVDGWRSMRTRGDGACSIHAALGELTEVGELAHPRPRTWIQQILERAGSYAYVQARCARAGLGMIWEDIAASLPNEFLLPWCAGEESTEAECFVTALSRLQPELLATCLNAVQHTEARVASHARAKAEVISQARNFFTRQNELTYIESLALMLGHVPGEFHSPPYFLNGAGDPLVVGTQQSFPDDGPHTKYEALFDPRTCFDAIRWSFIVSADPRMGVGTFHRLLIQLLEHDESLNEGLVLQLVDFLDAVRACGSQDLPDALPPDLIQLAWPSYVAALQDQAYWLSAAELTLLCCLDNVSVAVFESDGQTLKLAAAHIVEEVPPVMVKLTSNRHRRVRSHFERLQRHCQQQQPSRESSPDSSGAGAAAPQTSFALSGWQDFRQILGTLTNERLREYLQSFLNSVSSSAVHVAPEEMNDRRAELETKFGTQAMLQRLHWAGSKGSACGPTFYTRFAERFQAYLAFKTWAGAQPSGGSSSSSRLLRGPDGVSAEVSSGPEGDENSQPAAPRSDNARNHPQESPSEGIADGFQDWPAEESAPSEDELSDLTEDSDASDVFHVRALPSHLRTWMTVAWRRKSHSR